MSSFLSFKSRFLIPRKDSFAFFVLGMLPAFSYVAIPYLLYFPIFGYVSVNQFYFIAWLITIAAFIISLWAWYVAFKNLFLLFAIIVFFCMSVYLLV